MILSYGDVLISNNNQSMTNLISLLVMVFSTIGITGAYAETHGVLVAGSRQFYNYRHQTDICHSFQILSSNGVPSDNIIVMIYDDIADAKENPFPGQLFNKPTPNGTEGVDVYAGCQKDYTGDDVTAENFLNIITGNASAMQGIGSGKVLTSGKDDNVFIYFSDHGGTGIVAFPTGPFLQATDLNDALQKMYDNDMYAKLTFYMEACESGSMFEDILPDNINVYVTTAANPDESSWGTYCPPDQDSINGVHINACLGDEYSVNWMENADDQRNQSMRETLQDQYTIVKDETTMSHVTQYGDVDFTSLPIGDFEGEESLPKARTERHESLKHVNIGKLFNTHQKKAKKVNRSNGMMDSRDIKLQTLYFRYLRAESIVESSLYALKLKDEITHRMRVDALWLKFAQAVSQRRHGGIDNYEIYLPPSRIGHPKDSCQHSCCTRLFEQIRTSCPALYSYEAFNYGNHYVYENDKNDKKNENGSGWSDYALKYTRVVVNACKDAVAGTNKLKKMYEINELHTLLKQVCNGVANFS